MGCSGYNNSRQKANSHLHKDRSIDEWLEQEGQAVSVGAQDLGECVYI